MQVTQQVETTKQIARGLGAEIFSHIGYFADRREKLAKTGNLSDPQREKLRDNGNRLIVLGRRLLDIADMPVDTPMETPPEVVSVSDTTPSEVEALKQQLAELQAKLTGEPEAEAKPPKSQKVVQVTKSGGKLLADGTYITSTGRKFQGKPPGRQHGKIKPKGKKK